MSDLGFNKIAFCILGTGLAIIGFNEASHAFFHTTHHEKPGYDVPVVEETTNNVVEGPVDYYTLITTADLAKGKEQAAKCVQCHKFEQGAGALQGPELFNILGRDIASVGGFAYSTGKGSLAEMEGAWDYAHLDKFIEAPKRMAPNTKMNYGGINSKITGKQDRANLIAYLRSLAPAGQEYPLPAPLPPQPTTPDPAAPVDPNAPPTPPADGQATTPPGQTAPTNPAAPATTPAPTQPTPH